MKQKLFVMLLLVMMLVTAASAQSADTIVWTLGGDISTLNPALVTDGSSFQVINAIYEGLFHLNVDTGQPEPGLTSWVASEDGMQYTFTIREDANWSDGTPVTSADVKFIYDAILSDSVESPHKAAVGAIGSIEIVDDKNFVATLAAPNCTIWSGLGGFGLLTPIPSHLYAADFSDFMTSTNNLEPSVFSGAYKLAERSAGEFIRLEANESYYGGVSNIPNVVFRILGDPATLNQALQTGSVDYGFMYPDQYEQLAQREQFNTFLYPNANAPIVIMNQQANGSFQAAYDAEGNLNELVPNPYFADVRVRQAVAMGYDKLALALTLGENAGSVPLTGPVVPSFYGSYDMSDMPYWEYNPERAAALLEEAGWVMGDDGVRVKDGVRFEIDLVYSKLVDLWGNAALIMQDQLGQIGIKINIVEQEWSAYLGNNLLPGNFDITIVGFGGGNEVDGIAYNLLYSKNVVPGGGGFNLASYINPEMDRLLDEARTLPGCDPAARNELYREVQRIALEDVAYDWLVSTTQVHVLNSRVTDAYIGQWSFSLPGSEMLTWGLGE
jgi:peptide/nickel transport system substrate-binding protein